MADLRYEISLRVLKKCSQVDSDRGSDHEIFFMLYKILTIRNYVFGDFPKISEDFPKFVQRPDERFRMFPKGLRRQPKIAEGFRTYFDHTPTNLSAVNGAKMLAKMKSHVIKISLYLGYRFCQLITYVLLDVLLCSIAEYFTSCAVFWRARRASQNTNND